MAILYTLRTALDRRAAYNRTRRELRNMPLDVALDLDIDRAKADTIAHRATYGL